MRYRRFLPYRRSIKLSINRLVFGSEIYHPGHVFQAGSKGFVELSDADLRCLPLFLEFLVVFTDDEPTNSRLEVSDDLRQSFVPHVFQHSEHSRSKEHLGMSQTIVILVKRKS